LVKSIFVQTNVVGMYMYTHVNERIRYEIAQWTNIHKTPRTTTWLSRMYIWKQFA